MRKKQSVAAPRRHRFPRGTRVRCLSQKTGGMRTPPASAPPVCLKTVSQGFLFRQLSADRDRRASAGEHRASRADRRADVPRACPARAQDDALPASADARQAVPPQVRAGVRAALPQASDGGPAALPRVSGAEAAEADDAPHGEAAHGTHAPEAAEVSNNHHRPACSRRGTGSSAQGETLS